MPDTTTLPEAPASATFKYVHPDTGGEIMFTLRDSSGLALLDKLDAALLALTDRGAQIVPPRGATLATRFPAAPAATGNGHAAPPIVTGDAAPLCQLHQVEMRPSKWGGFYCPAPDQSTEKGYCTHKITKTGQYKR